MSKTGTAGVFGFARQSARGVKASSPYNSSAFVAGTNEVQTLTISGSPTGGSFQLSFTHDGETDAATIPHNATAAQIQHLLGGLKTIGFGNVAVTGSGPFTITFQNELGAQNVALFVVDNSGLTGGTSPAAAVVQTTPGVADTSAWYWVPATNLNFASQQIVQAIPAEVGGDDWSRGSYKGGVMGAGQMMFIPRGGLGLAEMLHGFAGAVTKTAGDGLNGAAVGNFIYEVTPNFAGEELPWYTFMRNVSGAFAEEFIDGRFGSFGFDVAATGLLNIDASMISRRCGEIPLGTGAASVGAQKAGNGLPFQAVDMTVRLDSNNNGVPAAVAHTPYKPTRLSIGFANQLTSDEFVVGSYFLEDVTKIARTAQVSYGLRLKDAELYRRVYSMGQPGKWSPEIWKGALEVTALGGRIGSSNDRYKLIVALPEMDYQAAPISLQGNNVVEYQLAANVVLSQNPAVRPFKITYITDENIIV